MCEHTGDDDDLAREIWYVIHSPRGARREGLLKGTDDVTHMREREDQVGS